MSDNKDKTDFPSEGRGGSGNPSHSRSGQADAKMILLHTLDSVFPESALRCHVSFDEKTLLLTVADRKYNLADFEKIFVVRGGKAGRRTGAELVAILGDQISS